MKFYRNIPLILQIPQGKAAYYRTTKVLVTRQALRYFRQVLCPDSSNMRFFQSGGIGEQLQDGMVLIIEVG